MGSIHLEVVSADAEPLSATRHAGVATALASEAGQNEAAEANYYETSIGLLNGGFSRVATRWLFCWCQSEL